MATINLNLGDCLEAMRAMPDNAYDLAIVDPPYGLGIDGQKKSLSKNPKHNRKEHTHKGWDSSIPSKEYFEELMRVSAEQIIWGANYFVKHLQNGTKGWVVWDKLQHGLTMSDCELAYSSFQKPTRVFYANRVILQQEGQTIHPTQKPVKLYEWLLDNYAKEGDSILDTHLGSGSIAIACYNRGFNLDAWEIDQEYHESALTRFNNHTNQLQLWLNQ